MNEIFCLAWNTANNYTPSRFSNTNNEWNNDWRKYGGKAINMKLVMFVFRMRFFNSNVFENGYFFSQDFPDKKGF